MRAKLRAAVTFITFVAMCTFLGEAGAFGLPWLQKSPVALQLHTYDGSGQTVHPDVIYIEGGFGEKRWPYWMAVTPYPKGNADMENPSVFASMDGVDWQVPPGLSNPIVPQPPGDKSHNSDPELLYDDGELILYYRQSTFTNGNSVQLFRVTSEDGIHWSEPVSVMQDTAKASLMSPTVWSDGEKLVMLLVNKEPNKPGRLYKSSSVDGLHWGPLVGVDIKGLPPGRSPWHLDVIAVDGVLHSLLVTATGDGGSGSRLHYAYSKDGGDNWVAEAGFLFPQQNKYDSSLQYRGSLLTLDKEKNTFKVWYSARATSGVWRTLYVPSQVLKAE